ncbi:MAG: hypothetical protein ABWX82_02920 [Leifsonia sp.]
MRTRGSLHAGVLVVLALALAGCAGLPSGGQPTTSEAAGQTPVASSTPTPTPAAIPTPTATPDPAPVDPLTTVTAIVMRPEALELRSPDGTVVASLGYMDSPADAVAALTAVFGAPPVVENHDGNSHFPPFTTHVWGALEVQERHYDEAAREVKNFNDIVWPRFAVYFDSPASGDIDLTTAQGSHAGDDWSTISDQTDVGIEGCNAVSVEVVRYDVVHEGYERTITAGVGARLSEDGAGILWLVSPELFGGDRGCP